MNPFSEIRALVGLWRLFRDVRPDVVHHVTLKPVLYGTVIARFVGVPAVVNAISGMGHVFVESGGLATALRGAVSIACRAGLRHRNMKVIFQNVEQRRLFLERGWVRDGEDVLIRGSGVDLARFGSPKRRRAPDAVPLVILASRMIETKGVEQFVEAARRLVASGVQARFVLVGEPDPENPASVSGERIGQWVRSGVVESWGRREDMPEIFAETDVVCLPTYYPEGVPKVLIEASAAGVPIVATDLPGCREIVRHGENGILVPARDVGALADALRRLIEDAEMRARMGAAGRRIAEQGFDIRSVVEATVEIYRDLLIASRRRNSSARS